MKFTQKELNEVAADMRKEGAVRTRMAETKRRASPHYYAQFVDACDTACSTGISIMEFVQRLVDEGFVPDTRAKGLYQSLARRKRLQRERMFAKAEQLRKRQEAQVEFKK